MRNHKIWIWFDLKEIQRIVINKLNRTYIKLATSSFGIVLVVRNWGWGIQRKCRHWASQKQTDLIRSKQMEDVYRSVWFPPASWKWLSRLGYLLWAVNIGTDEISAGACSSVAGTPVPLRANSTCPELEVIFALYSTNGSGSANKTIKIMISI